jgi:hypothetical protein
MIYGLDTGFLVAVEVVEHPDHASARAARRMLLTMDYLWMIAAATAVQHSICSTDSARKCTPPSSKISPTST